MPAAPEAETKVEPTGSEKKREATGWSIRRPETHQLGGAYTVFGPPPRSERRPSSRGKGDQLATYQRNVEFLKQREARLETARKAREEQELAQLAAPELTEGSRRLVHGSYAPPWAGKSAKVSCRAQKVLQAAIESKAQEEAEHTFRPQINARSKAIFRHVIDTGRPWHDRVHSGDRPGKPPGTKALTPEEQRHSFHPEISQKASQLRRPGNVSERLYAETKGESTKKTPVMKKRISKILTSECLREVTEVTTEPEETRSNGVAKLVEALRQRQSSAS